MHVVAMLISSQLCLVETYLIDAAALRYPAVAEPTVLSSMSQAQLPAAIAQSTIADPGSLEQLNYVSDISAGPTSVNHE